MRRIRSNQLGLIPDIVASFPATRYQGSKSKLIDWIWSHIAELDFTTCLDAFGGTGSVAYHLKRQSKDVTYNDILRFNYFFGLALIENDSTVLADEEVDWLLQRHENINYPTFVEANFSGIYFSDEENAWIDQTITNIRQLSNPYKFALAFFALCQACIIKRPFNLFHRRNLYIRFADVERSFGNKTTWDRAFSEWFRDFVAEANRAVWDNGKRNRATCFDAMTVSGEYDLVYIDTPYISQRGTPVDYLDFYHFLEGLTIYDEWHAAIDLKSKHRRLKPQRNPWTDRTLIHGAFDSLFKKYRESIIVVSYRSDGIPSENQLISLLEKHKSKVRVERFGQYKYVLSKNTDSEELLLIGT